MSEINGVVAGNQLFAVAVGKNANLDHWVVATSLFLALQAAGKQAVLIAPSKPDLEKQPELKPLFGLEQAGSELGKQNLLVSFPYSADAVDSVSYVIDEENQKFLLTIKPKAGNAPLAAADLTTTYTGAALEVLFLVGVHSWDQLGSIYAQHPSELTTAVRVAFHQFIPELAQMAFCPKQHTCLAELVPSVLDEAGLPLTVEAATNLLYGIEQQTDWLSSLRTNAATFTTVASLLQAGAKRQSRPTLVPQQSAVKQVASEQPVQKLAKKAGAKKITKSVSN